MRREHKFISGDCVILREERRDTHVVRDAREVRPERFGEGYRFVVDQFCRVSELRAGQLVLRTPRGETRVAEPDDPHLHVMSWWERFIYRHRFPKPG